MPRNKIQAGVIALRLFPKAGLGPELRADLPHASALTYRANAPPATSDRYHTSGAEGPQPGGYRAGGVSDGLTTFDTSKWFWDASRQGSGWGILLLLFSRGKIHTERCSPRCIGSSMALPCPGAEPEPGPMLPSPVHPLQP